MNLFGPSYLLATTTVGAGAGLWAWSGGRIEYITDGGIAPAVVGAAFGAVLGGVSLLMAPNPDKSRRSVLRGVYKNLMKQRYRVVKQYETKGANQVVLVLERGNNRKVVLKLPNPACDRGTVTFRSSEINREYRTIIEIGQKINSPHIVRVIDSFSGGDCDREDGYFITVLEYVPGPTLGEEMEKGPLTLTRVKEVFFSLAEGLRDVQNAGYVYNDLHPENVILNPERGAVLVDFEFASPTDHFNALYLEKWCLLLYEAIVGQRFAFPPKETVRSFLEKRKSLSPSEIEEVEILQKIIDRALKKPGTTPYPDFDSFIKDLDQWEVPR